MTTKELARHVMAEGALNTANALLLQLFTRRIGCAALAAQCRLANPQRELLSLARRYERRADYFAAPRGSDLGA